MKKSYIVPAITVLFILWIGVWYATSRQKTPSPNPVPSPVPATAQSIIATPHYACDTGKTIDVILYDGSSTPPKAPGMPPTPGGSADVSLSDGRSIHLAQTISADGVRYANENESFVFWTKGNGAFVMEGNAQTYANCTEALKGSNASTSTNSPASSTAWMNGMKVITQADNGETIHIAKNERFLIEFGDTLSWNMSFSPSGSITRIPNSTTADGFQGVYEASAIGNATLNAIGAPICTVGMMCPQFRVSVNIIFIVGS